MGRPSRRSCVICGIREQHKGVISLLFASFPLEQNRCKEWLRAVGNEDLVHLPIEKLHQLRFVCGNHFAKRDINKKGNRLKRRAIPKLNLNATPLSEDQLIDFPQHMASSSQLAHNSGLQPPIEDTDASRANQEENTVKSERDNETGSKPSKKTASDKRNTETVTELMPVATTNCQKQNIPVKHLQGSAHTQNILVDRSNIETNTMHTIQNIQVKQLQLDHFQASSALNSTALNENKENLQGKRKYEESLELSPKKKKLIEQLRKTKCTLRALKKSAKIIEDLESDVLKDLVKAAFKNQHRKPQGRRWTPKNKISALAIFKRSPRTYRHMAHTMPLPSVKTLQNLMKKIPMDTGISQSVLAHLNKISNKKKKNDKLCGLLFDEIALKKRMNFDVAADKVEGYEDFGNGKRTPDLADHALVFMLQGIRAKFKMPLAYYFVKGTINSQKLANIIKEIVTAVESTGFKIVTTVCDQGPTNLGALNILKSHNLSGENNFFMCNEQKVFTIFDIPHLFKSIRNNFYNNGQIVMADKKAKWSHLVQMEELNRNFLYLHKITKNSVEPKYRAKMKVKIAAQLLSMQASAVLKMMAKAERDPKVAEEIMETAIIVSDLDRLFDFTNGPSGPKEVKKGIRENVSLTTDHLNVWTEYRKKLESLTFTNLNGVKAKNVKCIQGYITTLSSLQDLWNKLKSEGFKFLNLRQLNQDALENLFGVIRQHSPTNRNPTCSNFVAALKSSIVSRLTAPHSRGSNCEQDFQELLTDFHDLLFEEQNITEVSVEQPNVSILIEEAGNYFNFAPVLSIPDEAEFADIECNLSELDQQPIVYVSGYIAANILKGRSCSVCENCLKIEDPEDDPTYSYISLREWWENKRSLTYPTIELCRLVEAAVKVFEAEIVPCLYYLNICKLTVTLFYAKCDSSFFKCDVHRKLMLDVLYFRLGCLLIRRQCQRINQGLSGNEEALADAYKKAQQHGAAK